MLDLKFIRENPDLIKKILLQRLKELDVERLLALDQERRALLQEVEGLKHQRNAVSDEIGALKKSGADVSGKVREMKAVAERIRLLDGMGRKVSGDLDSLLQRVPNIPHASVPVGPDARAQVLVKEWGEKREFGFTPRTHWEIADTLGLIDFARAAKIAGSHFALYTGKGALLERGLINFMLDFHTREHGYTEVSPPFLSNRASMLGTGQLPLLEEDMYRCELDDFFLIPTAEVSVTNIHRDEVLPLSALPRKYVAYTPCFRREAGSYGKETKGLIRIHQFDKVELVKFVLPETSWEEHEALLADAESVVRALGLPYRVASLPTGELSFASAKCYDIEVWAPGQKQWLEVSSCSNFEAFQARRANIRFSDGKEAPRFVHTLNASGVALPRTVVGILENFQQADGSVTVPEVLRPYLGGLASLAV